MLTSCYFCERRFVVLMPSRALFSDFYCTPLCYLRARIERALMMRETDSIEFERATQ